MRIALLIPFVLSACATFPALDGTISDEARNAPYPALTPIPLEPAIGDDEDVLQERIAALQERAARIREIDKGALQ
jgi:hypothetical protein